MDSKPNTAKPSGHSNGTPLAMHDGAPLLNKEGSNWTLMFNRPREHNRLDPLDVDAMLALFGQIELGKIDCPTALVIIGNHSKSFSSGYTLDAITQHLDDRFEKMLDTLEQLPCLTVAAINGNVYGGATDLALCCDIRIGQTGTRMFMPAAQFGLHYYPGGLRRYVTRLGLTAASKLMLTGMTIDAPEMLRVGFLTDLVEPTQMPMAVTEYVQAALKTEPIVVAKMKMHMQAIANTAAKDDAQVLQDSMQTAYQESVASPELARRLKQRLNK